MLQTQLIPHPPPVSSNDPIWGDTKERIANGRVTPFLSNYMSAALFHVARGEIAKSWAKDVHSPFSEVENSELAHVAQYYAVKVKSRLAAKQDYLTSLIRYLLGAAQQYPDMDQKLVQELVKGYTDTGGFSKPFSEIARDLGFPRFDTIENNPFRLLAEMPLPIYFTTSHHDFLEFALTQTGHKTPVSEIFYWGDHLDSIESIFDKNPTWEPSVDNPLVYHLYGRDCFPESIILSEDDYLDLLDRLAELRYQVKLADSNIGTTQRRRNDTPPPVRRALSGTALLCLGYGVYSWEFRVLFRSIIQSTGEGRQNRNLPPGICMQIEPNSVDGLQGNAEEIKQYLQEFFEGSYFKVYWGSVEACVEGIWKRWSGAPPAKANP